MDTDQTNDTSLEVSVISDVVCPWCVVGKLNLQKAAEQENIKIRWSWMPFQLNPAMPHEGQDLREHLTEKYGSSAEQSAAIRQRLQESVAEYDFTFNWSEDLRIYNTLDCHRLLQWAATKGLQDELQDQLTRCYFDQNLPLNSPEVLINAAIATGLDAQEAKNVLASDDYKEEVNQICQQWYGQGIQSVPTFIFNQKYLVNGGQPVENFRSMLRQIAQD